MNCISTVLKKKKGRRDEGRRGGAERGRAQTTRSGPAGTMVGTQAVEFCALRTVEDWRRYQRKQNSKYFPRKDGNEASSSRAEGEEKEKEEGAEPAAAVSGTSPHRERFDGFAKTNRKWFDESGYSGCLERLEELEGIVEAQFRDLHAKGYGLPKPASIGKDGPPLKLEELEELERAVERQHRTLVDSGVTDSLPIFAAK